MLKFKQYLESIGVSLPRGDVASVHKGKWTVLAHSQNWRKQELRRRLKDGSFLVKLFSLPDVSRFRIRLNSYNPLLSIGGISARQGSDKTLTKGPNRNINRYLTYMQHRLYVAKKENKFEEYWRIGLYLVVFSHSYLSYHLWKLDKNIYREKHLDVLKRLVKRVNELRGLLGPNKSVKLMSKKLNQKLSLPPRSNAISLLRKNRLSADQVMCFLLVYKRMYLPKAIDPITLEVKTYRPLGVPTKGWRVFQSMQLGILTGFFSPSTSQHGFVPSRGTLTAWKVVCDKVLSSRNIYEIDFKGYFPSVNASLIMNTLHRYGMPKGLADYFVEMGITPPDIKSLDKKKGDERNALFKLELDAIGLLRLNPQYEYKTVTKKVPTGVSPKAPKTIGELVGQQDSPVIHLSTLLTDKASIMEQLASGATVNQGATTHDWSSDSEVLERVEKLYKGKEVLKPKLLTVAEFGGNLDLFLEYLHDNMTKTNYGKSVLNTIIRARKPLGFEYVTETVKVPKKFELPSFVLDEKGNYIGEVLKEIFEDIKVRGASVVHQEICTELGYPLSDLQTYYWETLYEYFQVQSAIRESLNAVKTPQKGTEYFHTGVLGKEPPFKAVKEPQIEGLPQGSCLSPFLSLVLLDLFMKEILVHYPGVNYIAYADDVIFYSDDDSMFERFVADLDSLASSWGLEVAQNKSTLSKQRGVWKNTFLKFLGILYETGSQILRAATRKGSTQPYVFEVIRSLEDHLNDSEKMSEFSSAYAHAYWLTSLTGWNQLFYLYVLGLGKTLSNGKKLRRFLKSYETAWKQSFFSNKDRVGKIDYIYRSIVQVLKLRAQLEPLTRTIERESYFSGTFAGLFLSRLYIGKLNNVGFNTASGRQNFSPHEYKPGSLLHCMQAYSKNKFNTFNGTSYGFNIVADLSRSMAIDFSLNQGLFNSKNPRTSFSLRRNLKRMTLSLESSYSLEE